MKTKLLILTISFFLFLLTNCGELLRKKLNLKVIENDYIKIEHYNISEITSIHEFVDITSKRWNTTERIFEGNSGEIDSIYINKDSIIIETHKNIIIYDLAAIKGSYYIVIKEVD